MHFLILFLSFTVHAAAPGLGCGTYEFQGVPKLNKDGIQLFVNVSTLSEISLSPTIKDQGNLAPYVDLPVKGTLRISKITGPRSAKVMDLKNLNYGVPDPLNNTKHTFLKMQKKAKCL